ncbi:hypothetical protein B0H11DRAFT_482859 [Mycena galericulata]|nr:hypothetical protein B0H11DRAFT_482859 [Mycena galericulata]
MAIGEDGSPFILEPSSGPHRMAMNLAQDAITALHKNRALRLIVEDILLTMYNKIKRTEVHCLVDPAPRLQSWLSWLAAEKINIIFSPYINQARWGWVTKEVLKDKAEDFSMRVHVDLADLSSKVCVVPGYKYVISALNIVCQTRLGAEYRLPVEFFQFCFVMTTLHEATHLATKYVFPGLITPKELGTVLKYGEAGAGFEERMLGGRLVCEWESEHPAELQHLIALYIRADNGQDYPLLT